MLQRRRRTAAHNRVKEAKATKARIKRERQALAAADAESLRQAIRAASAPDGHEGIPMGAAYLARKAASYGGSIYGQQWDKYLKGALQIPIIDMLGITREFPGKRPQDLFPSWPFADFTQVPPVPAVPVLAKLTGRLFSAAVHEQMAVATLTELYLNASNPQREQMLALMHNIVGPKR